MRRTINITISTNVSNNETENDRLEYQQKMLNMFLGFCKLNIPNCVGVGCTVKDQDLLSSYLLTVDDRLYQKKLDEKFGNSIIEIIKENNNG